MPKKLPYIPFFTGDWLKDPAVCLCMPATRGVWIDLLCAMHEAGQSGELCGTPDQLARLARCSTSDLTQALTDLQTTGAAEVRSRNGLITVTNRRMKRAARERELDRERHRRARRKKHPEGVPNHDGHDFVTADFQACHGADSATQCEAESEVASRDGPASRACHDEVTRHPSYSSSISDKPPPPSEDLAGVDSEERRRLEEEVFGCGVDQARQAVNAALTAGCSPQQIRDAVLQWAKLPDLGPGALHHKLTTMQPHESADRRLPKPPPEPEYNRRKAEQKRREQDEALMIEIVKKGRRAGKPIDQIKAELAKLGLEYPE